MAKKKRQTGKWSAYKGNNNAILRAPSSTQSLIPVFRVSENGDFELENITELHMFDRVYEFTDINYITKDYSEKEQILLKLCRIYNSFNTSFKIVTVNKDRDKDALREVYVGKESPSDEIEEVFADEYNNITDERMKNRACYIEQKKYIVITCEKKTFEEAEIALDQIEKHLMGEFGDMQSKLRRLSGLERLSLLHDMYRPDEKNLFAARWDDILSKDFVDSIASSSVVPVDKGGRQFMIVDGKYVSTLVIRKNGYPTRLSNNFLQDIYSLPYEAIITLDVSPIPPDVVQETLTRKLDSVETKIARQQEVRNKNQQYSSDITYQVKKEKENIKHYLDNVTENDQKMFFSQLLITIYAENETELGERIDDVMTIGRKNVLSIVPYCLAQEEAFQTAIPTGARLVNNMCRSLFTNALIAFQPFSVKELYQKGDKVYGINQISKKLIVGDRRNLLNGNGWVFGVPGTGKSFQSKMEIGQILCGSDDDVIIIDPQNEYEEIAKVLKGQFIDLSATTSNYVNPLSIGESIEENEIDSFMTSKSEFLSDIMTQIMEGELTVMGKSYIDKASRVMFSQILRKPRKEWISPTFSDFRDSLISLKNPIADDIAEALYRFTEGSLSIFNHQTNINDSGRFIVYGTQNLGKELTRLSMLIMLEAIRNRLLSNARRGKVTWVYVDEAHELTQNEFTALALERNWKEVRKQGGFMTGMTQNITDTLRNKTTRTMLANSEFLLLLGQANVDLEPLLDVVDISRRELQYVQGEEPGVGLLRFGKTIVPFNNNIPKESRIYDLFNTNQHEKIAEGYFSKEDRMATDN